MTTPDTPSPTPEEAIKPLLLMAEDEEDTASLLQFLLERAGYVVLHARDGMEAQGLVDTHDHLDLILLDINLPFINGLDVLTHIRRKPGWERVPVIMLTADGSEQDVRQALRAGANDYILKPFNPRELTVRLDRFRKYLV